MTVEKWPSLSLTVVDEGDVLVEWRRFMTDVKSMGKTFHRREDSPITCVSVTKSQTLSANADNMCPTVHCDSRFWDARVHIS